MGFLERVESEESVGEAGEEERKRKERRGEKFCSVHRF